jgi:hypothetical protein
MSDRKIYRSGPEINGARGEKAKIPEITSEEDLLKFLNIKIEEIKKHEDKAQEDTSLFEYYKSQVYALLVCVDAYGKYDAAQGKKVIFNQLLNTLKDEVIAPLEKGLKDIKVDRNELRGIRLRGEKIKNTFKSLNAIKTRIDTKLADESSGWNSWYDLLGILAHPFEGFFFEQADANTGRKDALNIGLSKVEEMMSAIKTNLEKEDEKNQKLTNQNIHQI